MFNLEIFSNVSGWVFVLLLLMILKILLLCVLLCIISLYLATYLCNLYIWCNSLLGLSSSISTNAGLVTSPTLIEGAAVDSPSSTGWDLSKLILKLTKKQFKTCCLMKFFPSLVPPQKIMHFGKHQRGAKDQKNLVLYNQEVKIYFKSSFINTCYIFTML